MPGARPSASVRLSAFRRPRQGEAPPVAKLLDDLRGDHANMARLLELLERQLLVFERGDDPDYALIADILAYCQAHPDRYHHPKEDALLAALRARVPALADELATLPREHAELAEATRRFAAIAELVLRDQEMPRARFADAARAFVDLYRRHMEWEERVLFPRAADALGPADWQQVENQVRPLADPLFDGDAARFRQLRRALLEPS
jgi:hemerythrin-like domain-containing protein